MTTVFGDTEFQASTTNASDASQATSTSLEDAKLWEEPEPNGRDVWPLTITRKSAVSAMPGTDTDKLTTMPIAARHQAAQKPLWIL